MGWLAIALAAALAAGGCTEAPGPEHGDAPPRVAQVTCDEDHIELAVPTVEAQRDGVHVRIRSRSREPLIFTFSLRDRPGGQIEAPTDRTVVLPIPPGASRIRCETTDGEGRRSAPAETLNVVAEEGLFRPADPECPGGRLLYSSEFVVDGGRRGDLIDVARKDFVGLRPGDRVQRAGYPDSHPVLVRVVRNARVVAVREYARTKRGWLSTQSWGCRDVQ